MTSFFGLQIFIKCATSVLRSEGRRSFVSGISSLTDLSTEAQTYLGCDDISKSHISSGHTRHERTKRKSHIGILLCHLHDIIFFLPC